MLNWSNWLCEIGNAKNNKRNTRKREKFAALLRGGRERKRMNDAE